jgi:hypothetical protein
MGGRNLKMWKFEKVKMMEPFHPLCCHLEGPCWTLAV